MHENRGREGGEDWKGHRVRREKLEGDRKELEEHKGLRKEPRKNRGIKSAYSGVNCKNLHDLISLLIYYQCSSLLGWL